jgi:hypothetical protein
MEITISMFRDNGGFLIYSPDVRTVTGRATVLARRQTRDRAIGAMECARHLARVFKDETNEYRIAGIIQGELNE